MNPLFLCEPWVLQIARVFDGAGAPLYAVGGSVRNQLMGLPASDMDVCGPARPEAVEALCEGTPVRAFLRAAHFGTVELHVTDGAGRHMAEYTTFRVDSYRCGHRPSAIRFAETPEMDALRRDFSVNAMYRPLHAGGAGEVIDPTGGLEHMRRGVLHTVTANPDQVLKDDGLRILRAARFQAELGFTPTEALLDSAAKFTPLLGDIARERLHDELQKLLLSDLRYPALARTVPPVTAGLRTLQRVGAWEPLFGSMAYDEAGAEAQTAYRAPEGIPPVSGKLALLFRRERPETLEEAMQSLRFSLRETQTAVAALRAMRALEDGDLSRFDALRLGIPALAHAREALRALGAADAIGEEREAVGRALRRADERLDALRQAGVPLTLRELAMDGNEVLLLCRERKQPANRVGETLFCLWREVVEGEIPNKPEILRARADALLSHG